MSLRPRANTFRPALSLKFVRSRLPARVSVAFHPASAASVMTNGESSTTLRAARERPDVRGLCLTPNLDTARRLTLACGVLHEPKLVLLDGWGHDLPAQLHDKLAGLIVAHAREAAT